MTWDCIGNMIKDNLPDSLKWVMEMYTLVECVPVVQICMQSWYSWYRKEIEPLNVLLRDLLINTAEQAMIEHYRPCLNVMGNRKPSPLPDRYEKNPIANKGVRLA
jgi:hypothetical protein